MPELEVGAVYFSLKYADKFLAYPEVESLVYVGKNLSDEDEVDTWYFEFLASFREGLGTPQRDSRERLVRCVRARDLSEILDVSSLAAALKEADQRRRTGLPASGHP
jgi:hypothetical protein